MNMWSCIAIVGIWFATMLMYVIPSIIATRNDMEYNSNAVGLFFALLATFLILAVEAGV